MWMTLLLIARVACEWVEISQHHYRKPGRTHHTTKVYANQTIAPQTWTDRDIDRNAFIHNVTLDDEQKEFAGTVERVPSVGIIRRVQLSNTPVKSPAGMETASDKLYTDFEVSLENEPEELHRRLYNNRQPQVNTEMNNFNTRVTNVTFKNYSLVNYDERNHFEALNTKTMDEDLNNFRSKGKIDKTIPKVYEEKITKIATETTTEESSKTPSKQNLVPTENTIIDPEYTKHVNNNEHNWQHGPAIGKIDEVSSDSFEDEKANHEGATTDQTPTMDNKANKMEFLVKLMKTVADTISQNSHRSLRSKMRYLHELKNTMLANIENRIDTLWPDDDTDPQNGMKRRGRSTLGSARGHVEFPSSESTLMTISFLTFAVFLIKLVLQVIQTYKNKAMVVAPLVVATAGRAAGRRLRNNDK